MSIFLTEKDIKDICYTIAKAHLEYDEPIPSFDSRYEGKLETALATPQKTVGGKLAHGSLVEQAAVLFYNMVKLHPFLNGNKRIAVTTLMTFLYLNEFWIEVDWKELYDAAIITASSETTNKDGMVKFLEGLIKNNLKKV